MSEHKQKISGFVIAYNCAATIETCLRSLRFVDELIVVDKSSTDATPAIAARYADKLITVPWSPIGAETRPIAYAACSHDFIVFLDHDECLNVAALRWIKDNFSSFPSDVIYFPRREYVLGLHNEDAYYWPTAVLRAFRRGAAEFKPTVHDPVTVLSPNTYSIPISSGACIHNLSHRDVHQWIEKTNRYTSAEDRVSTFELGAALETFGQERIAYWLAQSKSRDEYVVVVALLRAVYDIVDRLKHWESGQNIDGEREFAAICAKLQASYNEYESLEREKRDDSPVI